MAVATVDVKDVIGEHLAKILASSTARRHADLIDATKALVAALDAGDFVAPVKAATTPARRSLERARTPDASSEPPRDAAPPAAPASPPPPPSPRASLVSGLSDDRVDALLVVFRLAFDSKSPKIVDAALAALAKLIARGLVRGEADLPAPSTGAGAGERTPPRRSPRETSVGANLADAAGEDDRSASASASDPSASDPSASDSPTRRPPLTPPRRTTTARASPRPAAMRGSPPPPPPPRVRFGRARTRTRASSSISRAARARCSTRGRSFGCSSACSRR